MKTKNVVGVDTHKDTLACYCNGKFKEFKTTNNGFVQAFKWANSDIWAIEGAYGFGQAFSFFLTKNGCKVYDFNPLLTKNLRTALSISNPKNDYGDAKVISLYANVDNMETVSFETIKFKEKLSARSSLVKQKTQIINFLKMLYYTRGEELPFNSFDTKKAINYFKSKEDVVIKAQVNILEQILISIKAIELELEKEIPEQAKKLTQLKGISTITAITIYTETKGRITKEANFASYCGVSPVDCSSGRTNRKRTNKSGNRKLNSIFYSLSIAQKRYDEKAKAYYEKKISEGKTPRHARKCLARQLTRIVFRILKNG
jgi:transposase